MTVQEIIDKFMKIEDKSKNVCAGFGMDYFGEVAEVVEHKDEIELK